MGTHINLNYLRALDTSLDCVKLVLDEPDDYYEKAEDQQYTEIYLGIQEEMMKSAKYLVGGESGSSYAIRGWFEGSEIGGWPSEMIVNEWHFGGQEDRGQKFEVPA